jgi:hypothetical protein
MFIDRSHNARTAPFGGAEINQSLTTQNHSAPRTEPDGFLLVDL